jgi:hypothetical protein
MDPCLDRQTGVTLHYHGGSIKRKADKSKKYNTGGQSKYKCSAKGLLSFNDITHENSSTSFMIF